MQRHNIAKDIPISINLTMNLDLTAGANIRGEKIYTIHGSM